MRNLASWPYLETLWPFKRSTKFIIVQVNFHIRRLADINPWVMTAQAKRAPICFCRPIGHVVRQGQVRRMARVTAALGQEEVNELEFDTTARNAVNNPLALELLGDNSWIKGTLQYHRVSRCRIQSSFS